MIMLLSLSLLSFPALNWRWISWATARPAQTLQHLFRWGWDIYVKAENVLFV